MICLGSYGVRVNSTIWSFYRTVLKLLSQAIYPTIAMYKHTKTQSKLTLNLPPPIMQTAQCLLSSLHQHPSDHPQNEIILYNIAALAVFSTDCATRGLWEYHRFYVYAFHPLTLMWQSLMLFVCDIGLVLYVPFTCAHYHLLSLSLLPAWKVIA